MLSTAFLFAASMVVGQAEDPAVPQRAKDALNFLVGSWTVDGRVGEQKYKGEQQTRWAQGKHCVIANWTGSLGNREVHGTAIIGWDAGEGQVVDAGFIDTVGHRTIRWTIENDNAWEGQMRGFLLGKEAETTARFEKKGPDQYIVAFDAAGDMPENEYVLSRFVKPRSTKKPQKSQR